ncbi:Uncharacterised protein [Bordetella trematum]|uniref:Uncharacterized protein n=2 Tax=Bordetella trematum TaxID=123899 RepID=A0A157SL79_9BORD|nr:Uncharacterised protein [Bordetella trematum]SAI70646.1 Uncharacterised protein [Bordetella trematum]SUV98693.1 Uncharacterised protein [Bordetella trematum]
MADVGEFFADLLRPRWVAGLNKVKTPTVLGVESWLKSGTYSWLPSPAGTVKLDVSIGIDELAEAMASEVARFSCACYESLLDAVPRGHADRALGWALVRYYYATFYAAHALLRISGRSVTMISPQTASTLNVVGGQYLGMSPNISTGLHLVQVDSSSHPHVLMSKIGGSNGGSHEEMWKLFLALVVELEGQLILTQGQSQEALYAVQVLTNLRAQLCRRGKSNGAWLSSIRNDLNYRHDHGVWYPYKVSSKVAIALTGKMQRWIPNAADGYEIGKVTDDLGCFVDSCNVMARLLTAALKDVSGRAENSRSSFVDRQPFKLLRLRSITV